MWQPQHHSQRKCARCGLPLTDAASQEEGIGPICRQLDNAVLAKKIPSNAAEALSWFHYLAMDSVPPQAASVLVDLETALTREKAAERQDWRVEVKRVEWLLSFPVSMQVRGWLTKLIASLGYVGLAALWQGQASTGKTAVFFDAEKKLLILVGSNNKSGKQAFKKAGGSYIYNTHLLPEAFKSTLDKDLVGKSGFALPASKYATFKEIVSQHWVATDSKLLETTCHLAWMQVVPADEPVISVPAAPAKAPSKVEVLKEGEWLLIKTPYHKGFVAAIKTLPKADRKWSYDDCRWRALVAHQPQVLGWLKEFYGEEPEVAQA